MIPGKRNARRGPGDFDKAQHVRQQRSADRAPRPFAVVIRSGSKCGLWGRFETIEAAASVAKRLRQIGLPSEVEERET